MLFFFLSCASVSICGFGKNGHHLPQGRHCVFLRPGHDLRSYLLPENATSVKHIDAVLGKVNLPSWCFIVLRHGGHAHRRVYCLLLLRRVAAANTFFRVSLVGILPTCYRLSVTLYLPWGSQVLLCTIVTMFSKILNETVKTFAVFPS